MSLSADFAAKVPGKSYLANKAKAIFSTFADKMIEHIPTDFFYDFRPEICGFSPQLPKNAQIPGIVRKKMSKHRFVPPDSPRFAF